jgi:hypothetical protein
MDSELLGLQPDRFPSNEVFSQKAGRLLGLGAAGLGLYILLALRYPLAGSLSNPRAGWADLVGDKWNNIAIHFGIYLSLTLIYAAALRLLNAPPELKAGENGKQSEARLGLNGIIVLTWLAGCIILLAVAPAGESHDIFDYIYRGRIMVEFSGNPLAEAPNVYPNEAYYRYIAWYRSVDTYGPVWEIVSASVATGVHRVARLLGWWESALPSCPENPTSCRLLMTYITGYRLLAILLMGVSAWLIASMVRRSQPRLVPAALATWLWNPLALFAAAVGGHNDLLMVCLLLGGLWLVQRQRLFLALMALILALHIKLTALIWLPVFILWIIRMRGWRRGLLIAAGSLTAGVLVSWLLYLPFDGWSSLPNMLHERSLYLANSPWQVVYYSIFRKQGLPQTVSTNLTVALSTCLFMASMVLLSLWMFNFSPKRWRLRAGPLESDAHRLWQAVTATSLLYLVFGAFWFQHWYLLWVLAPAALMPSSTFTRTFLPWMSFGALLTNFSAGYLVKGLPKNSTRMQISLLTLMMIWAPGLIALMSSLAQRLRRGSLFQGRPSRAD